MKEKSAPKMIYDDDQNYRAKNIGAITGIVVTIGILVAVAVGFYLRQSGAVETKTIVEQTQNSEPTAQIEQAVKEYFLKSHPAPYNGTPKPPAKLIGITLQKHKDTFYVVGADIEYPDGKRTIEQVICRQFSGQGKTYWQAESFESYKVKQFGGEK